MKVGKTEKISGKNKCLPSLCPEMLGKKSTFTFWDVPPVGFLQAPTVKKCSYWKHHLAGAVWNMDQVKG